VAKNKIKVLVMITLMEEGEQANMLRQFEVIAKEKGDTQTEAQLALKIFQAIDKEWKTENCEAWAV
jgi:hypothetical protein